MNFSLLIRILLFFIHTGLLDNSIIFDTYGDVFIRLWTAMKEDVEHDRKARNKEAVKFFEKMYNAAVIHWTNNTGDKLPEPYRY